MGDEMMMPSPLPATPSPAPPSPTPEAAPPARPYISATQIGSWTMCPRRWAYRYVCGIHSPSSGAAVQGKALHGAIQHGYQIVIGGDPLPPAAHLCEVFAAELDHVREHEVCRLGDGEDWDALRGEGQHLMAAFREGIMARRQPAETEVRIEVSLGEEFPFTLLGFIDLVTTDGWICDHKFRSKRRGLPRRADLDADLQLTMYSLLYRASRQQVETGLALDVVVKGATPPKVATCTTTRDTHDLEWLLGLIHAMAGSISTGVYQPCGGPTSGWWCSEKWCDHWEACREDHDWPEGAMPALVAAEAAAEAAAEEEGA
jgi:hypothetical protein